jgi:hypothetical protein
MTITDLERAFEQPLPGIKGHQLLMPSYRNALKFAAVEAKNPRRAGVLVHLFDGVDGLEVLLMKRPEYKGTHSGQISFPGGKFEPGDQTLKETAFREAFEGSWSSQGKVAVHRCVELAVYTAFKLLRRTVCDVQFKMPRIGPAERRSCLYLVRSFGENL